jgi:hypothetical protein
MRQLAHALYGNSLVRKGLARIRTTLAALDRFRLPSLPPLFARAANSLACDPPAIDSIPMRVVGRRAETPDTATLRLLPAGARPFPLFAAGQFALVFADLAGVRTSRACSFSSPPQRLPGVEITVPVRPGEHLSPYLAHPARVGETLAVSDPQGDFHYRPDRDGDDLVLVAAGSAVTPCLAIVEAALASRRPHRVLLVHVARYERDLLFRDRLRSLTRSSDRFRLVVSLTRPDAAWSGERGRIDREMLERHVPVRERGDTTWLVCGPPMMCWDMAFILDDLGVPRDHVRGETFGSSMEHGRSAA